MKVAFYGPMCSGKTYMAKHLVDHYGFLKVGFADKLKEVSRDLFWINPADKNDRTRRLLQEFSDDIKKWGGEDIFVRHFLAKISDIPFMSIVCDDLRYTFEADALREQGFLIIGVNAYENIRQERILKLYPDTSPEAQQHRSETDSKLIEPDYTIWSNYATDTLVMDTFLIDRKVSPV